MTSLSFGPQLFTKIAAVLIEATGLDGYFAGGWGGFRQLQKNFWRLRTSKLPTVLLGSSSGAEKKTHQRRYPNALWGLGLRVLPGKVRFLNRSDSIFDKLRHGIEFIRYARCLRGPNEIFLSAI
jgi:hypothetical protein